MYNYYVPGFKSQGLGTAEVYKYESGTSQVICIGSVHVTAISL